MGKIVAKDHNKTINAVSTHLNNFFILPSQRMVGKFELINGAIKLPMLLKVNQRLYIEPSDEHMEATGSYRITSRLSLEGIAAAPNVYLHTLDGLSPLHDDTGAIIQEGISDTWTGRIFGQNMPADFISLCERIATWESENLPSNLVSESISGFYSKTIATNEYGSPQTALDVFREELARWRKSSLLSGVRC